MPPQSCHFCQKLLGRRQQRFCSRRCHLAWNRTYAQAEAAQWQFHYDRLKSFLTVRERKIFRMRASGKSLSHIAKQLNVTPQYVSSVYSNLKKYLQWGRRGNA